MRVFVTGGSGVVGSVVVPDLVRAGHTVVALARSDRSASVLESLGAEVRRGDLDDLDALAAAAAASDGVVHLAFKHDLQAAGDLPGACEADLRVVRALGGALRGSDKPFVGANATGALALGGFEGVLTERDDLPGGLRIDAENEIVALARQGVRSAVVRLPPTVHGGGRFGFASGLMEIARATGTSGWIGDGGNRWPSVGVDDVALVFRLALESAPPGSRLHAVAEEGIGVRSIATTIGDRLGLPTASVPEERAQEHFGHLAPFVRLHNPASNHDTRALLDWTPSGPGLLEELAQDGDAGVEPGSAQVVE